MVTYDHEIRFLLSTLILISRIDVALDLLKKIMFLSDMSAMTCSCEWEAESCAYPLYIYSILTI